LSKNFFYTNKLLRHGLQKCVSNHSIFKLKPLFHTTTVHPSSFPSQTNAANTIFLFVFSRPFRILATRNTDAVFAWRAQSDFCTHQHRIFQPFGGGKRVDGGREKEGRWWFFGKDFCVDFLGVFMGCVSACVCFLLGFLEF
jgi:hypothetical protein